MNQNDEKVIWKVIIISPVNFVSEIEKLITITSGDYSPSITVFEIKDDLEIVLIEIYFDYKPDINILNTKISKTAYSFGIKSPPLKLEKIEDIEILRFLEMIHFCVDFRFLFELSCGEIFWNSKRRRHLIF